MRLLFIDIHGRYLNPTNSMIPAMLKLNHEVVLYGPGLSCDVDLEEGVEKFIERHGDFDFVVSTEAQLSDSEDHLAWHNRYAYPYHRPEAMRSFAIDVNRFLSRTTFRRLVFLTKLDAYALPDYFIELMTARDAYYVAWADGFTKPVEQLTVFNKEKDYNRKVEKEFKFDAWLEFIHANSARFINLGHIIGTHEFDWRPLDERQACAVVPGVRYFRRADTFNRLRAAGLAAADTRLFSRFLSLADYCGLRPYGRPLLQQIYNARFVNAIASARYAYADGSGFDALVRKFFEIPALGAVLLCSPCTGFRNVGFIDGLNSVVVDSTTIVDAINELERHPATAQKIAEAGRRLIWDKHSITARAGQITSCLEAIQEHRFAGSVWRNGVFEIQAPVAAADTMSVGRA